MPSYGGTYPRAGGARPRAGGAYIAGDVTITGRVKAARLWATGLGTAGAAAVAIGVLGNDGLYSGAPGQVIIAAGGNAPMYWLGTGSNALGALNVTGDLAMGLGSQILADYGSLLEPGVAFNGRGGVGFYSPAVNTGGMVASSANTHAWDGANYFQTPSYINGAMYWPEGAAPVAIANYFTIFGSDVATKTRATLKLGAAGTLVVLGTEV